MKKYTKKQWNDVKLYNSWEIMIVGGSPGMIMWRSPSPIQAPAWAISTRSRCEEEVTLFDYWRTARTYQEQKRLALQDAQAIADKKYHIATAWERDVFGGWHPEGTMDRAMAKAMARKEQPK